MHGIQNLLRLCYQNLLAAWRARQLRRAIERSRADPNAKCPACGNTDGEIRWSDLHQCLLHVCRVCHAMWGEKPIVKAEHWRVEMPEMETSDLWPFTLRPISSERDLKETANGVKTAKES
jgi:hypothetical protein